MKKLNISMEKLKESSWYKQVFSDNTLYFLWGVEIEVMGILLVL